MNNLISGPCSVESTEQFEETLKGLLKQGITNIRAGVWKPRTNAGEFEGLGIEALDIIHNAKMKGYDFTSFVEVANKNHVRNCEIYEIDVFWIGSRTTGNPFAVQEIAEAIYDKDKVILVKNPMQNDLKLWIGAINRFKKLGFKNVLPVFRGFSTKGLYRNQPEWGVLEGLKKELGYDSCDIIIDASHIAGDRIYLKEIINKAKDLGYSAFMLESHFNPTEALTDSDQQIEPNEIFDYLDSPQTLDYERNIIDDIDNKIIELLNKRFEASNQIGFKKKKTKSEVFNHKRFKEVSEKYGEFQEVYEAIHNISIIKQRKL